MDNLLAGTLILPWRVHCAGYDVQRRCPCQNIPGNAKAIPGLGENRSPSRRNRCSPSARNPVRLHPGIVFTFTPESFSPCPGIRRGWGVLPKDEKIVYCQGVKDGIMIAVTYLENREVDRVLEITQAKGFSIEDYIKELDALYRDRENLPIPVPIAYQHVNLKLKGTATKDELERHLIDIRKALAKY